jgi:integral membrane sensor domain MASE1
MLDNERIADMDVVHADIGNGNSRVPMSAARGIAMLVLVALLYFTSGRLAIALSDSAGGVVPLWPASAILLVAVILLSGRWRWGVLVICYLANIGVGLSVGDEPKVAAAFAFADTLDVVLALMLLNVARFQPRQVETHR